MTGFIRGLFGGSKKENVAPQPKPKKETAEFFLDFDTAQTFGDIERMRKEVEVHKSFPKGTVPVAQPAKSTTSKPAASSKTESAPTTNASTSGETLDRRKSDRSMDAFRSMVKDMKK